MQIFWTILGEMALNRCKKCGREVSQTARRCPNCGNYLRSPGRKISARIIAIYALLVIAAVMVLANPSAFLRWGLAGEIIFVAILAIAAYFLVKWLRRARRD